MDFDADWILPAIFIGVMLVRALVSRITRAGKRSQPAPEKPLKRVRSESADDQSVDDPEVYQVGEKPKPIEPR